MGRVGAAAVAVLGGDSFVGVRVVCSRYSAFIVVVVVVARVVVLVLVRVSVIVGRYHFRTRECVPARWIFAKSSSICNPSITRYS